MHQIFIKIHQTHDFDENFDAFKLNHIFTKGGGKCVKIFIKIHQTLNFDENFDAFDMGVKIEKYQKDEKIEFDGV